MLQTVFIVTTVRLVSPSWNYVQNFCTQENVFPPWFKVNHEFQAIKQPGKKPFSLALCIFVYTCTCYVRILVSNSTKRVEGTTVTAEP